MVMQDSERGGNIQVVVECGREAVREPIGNGDIRKTLTGSALKCDDAVQGCCGVGEGLLVVIQR